MERIRKEKSETKVSHAHSNALVSLFVLPVGVRYLNFTSIHRQLFHTATIHRNLDSRIGTFNRPDSHAVFQRNGVFEARRGTKGHVRFVSRSFYGQCICGRRKVAAVKAKSTVEAVLGSAEDEPILRMPLDLYSMLRAPRTADQTEIQSAYENRISDSFPEGFSECALQQRKELILQAFGVLEDVKQREAYDEHFNNALALESSQTIARLDPAIVQVPYAYRLGGFLLLFELGRYDECIRLGKETLERENSNAEKEQTYSVYLPPSDVILAMVLSYKAKGKVLVDEHNFDEGGLVLEEGLQVLFNFHKQRTDSMQPKFPSVEVELQEELTRIRAPRIIELISIDLRSVNVPKRNRGIHLLQTWVEERGGIDGPGVHDPSGLSQSDFLRFVAEVRPRLSIKEQEDIFKPTPRRFSPCALQIVAQAAIGRGFLEKNPLAFVEGQRALQRLEREGLSVPLELAMVNMLLGRPDRAKGYLTSIAKARPDVYKFIQRTEDNNVDNALMRTLEKYLNTEVVPRFRDFEGQSKVTLQSLKAFFFDRGVSEVLLRMKEANSAYASAGSGVGTVETGVLEENYGGEGEDAGLRESIFPDHEADEVPVVPRTRPPPSSVSRKDAGDLETRMSARRRKIESQKIQRQAGFKSEATEEKRAAGMRVLGGLVLIGSALFLAFGGLRALLKWDAPREEVQETVVEDENAPLLDANGEPIVQTTTDSATSTVDSNDKAVTTDAKKTTASDTTKSPADISVTALSVVRQWQAIKSEALGATHNVDRLRDILVEPALTSWRQRADNVKALRSHWSFKLTDIKVDKVESGGAPNPTTGTVYVTLTEQAEYYGKDGKLIRPQSYNKSYRAKYTVVQVGGAWKVKGMDVIR
mmetsp:Transcript_40416/g.65560  ORF Transcript_40416/g.65560 Transcript_40416/m.65560 type:complete len:871 (-) Transcript_40416:560-3172(-)